jgi:N-acyl-D-amino-acid deacylase
MSEPRNVSRRRFLSSSGAALAGLALSRRPLIEAAPRFDLVLKGGTLIDGTGGPGYPGDLGIVGDRIEVIGAIGEAQAARVLDVTGLHVSPGFIDIHTHSDGEILAYPTADSRVRQGVTTELAGNCGSSVAPLVGKDVEQRREQLLEDGIEPDWSDVSSYLERLERDGISINQALLLGQGTLRASAIGLADRPLAPAELAVLLRAVEEGMEQGAFGISTGLEYTPGRYTPTDEIVALTRRVARRGGLYASHIRNEETTLLEAVDEAIAVGRRSGARVEISHLKAAGRPNWGKQRAALDLIESARRDGVEVLADAYPYTAYSTSLTIQLPDWALEDGVEAMLGRLADKEARARIRKEVAARIAGDPGDYDLIVISRVRTPTNRNLVGRNLIEISATWGLEPVDAALRLIEEERGEVGFIGHGMSEANVERVLAHPLVMIGSDGSSMAPVGRAAETRPHPRSYGAFARVLGLYVRERGLFGLETAVRKMTSQPADQIGLPDRGRLAPGQRADVVVFDAPRVKDEASFESPHRYASGIAHVLVNGRLVVEDGEHTGAKPGRALRKG